MGERLVARALARRLRIVRTERDALAATVQRVQALADEWRYKGEFGWGPWQIGEGPDPEGHVLDECAADLRAALAPPPGPAAPGGHGEGRA